MNSSLDSKPIVLIGAGGHASVLADILLSQGREIVAIVSPDVPERKVFMRIKTFYRDDEEVISALDPASVELVCGVGIMPNNNLRTKILEKFGARGYEFASVIAPSAVVSKFAAISSGAQILSSVTINAGATIASNSIINTAAVVEHDCIIEENVHIAPRAVICGDTRVQAGAIVGPGAVVTQSLTIGQGVVIGAGASIVRSVSRHTTVLPAKIRTNKS